MTSASRYAAAAFFALLAGCAAVRTAREAQNEARGAAEGEVRPAAPVGLSGASLETLVAFAVSNRPSIAAARLQVEDARLQLKSIAADAPVASSTPWNAVDASARLGYSESSKSAHFENLGSTEKGKMSGSLSLDLLVYDFGRNAARAKAQAERVVANELALAQEGYAVFAEVATCYFTLLQNEALREVAASNMVQYAEHLERAEDMFETGEAQKLDVLRAELDLAQSRENLVSASNEVAVAGAKLMSALGIDSLSGDFRKVLGERAAGLDAAERVFVPTRYSSSEAFAFARTNAPALQIARSRLKAASSEVDAAVADLMPSVSAGISMNWTDPLWYWRWSVDAVQSVFTGWRKTLAVDRARVALKSAETDVFAREQELSRQIEIAVAERDNAVAAEATAADSVASAKENLDMVASQFEVGDVSRVDFTAAASSYASALGNRVKAFYRGQIAEACLFELMGVSPAYAGRGGGNNGQQEDAK